MGTDTGISRTLFTVVGAIARPGGAFGAIARAPDRYLAPSVVIFAVVCLSSVLSSADMRPEPGGGAFGFGGSVQAYEALFIGAALHNFLLIAVIFWIGNRYGRKLKFKNAFPVLSYCLIPVAVGAAASLAGAHLFDLSGPMSVGGPDGGLSPSYALDFATSGILVQNVFAGFFLIWIFVLLVKATKILYGFGTVKAVGVLALAIAATYALSIVLGILKVFLLPVGLL